MLAEILYAYSIRKGLDVYLKSLQKLFKVDINFEEKKSILKKASSYLREYYDEDLLGGELENFLTTDEFINGIDKFLKPFETFDVNEINSEIDYSTLPSDFRDNLVSSIIKALLDSELFEDKLKSTFLINEIYEIKKALDKIKCHLNDKNEITYLQTSVPPTKKIYPYVKYIKRFITPQLNDDPFRNLYVDYILDPENLEEELDFSDFGNYDNTLIDLIEGEKQKQIVLLSTAGYGKSTELQYLAYHFSNADSELFPVKISLNLIEDENIEEFLSLEFKEWDNIPRNKLLVILDGLDEVHTDKIDFAFKKIEKFSIAHPDSYIIVSCRNNFYTVETGNTQGSLHGFKSYFLDDITTYHIIKFSKEELGIKYKVFLKELVDKKKGELLKNPFYLINLIEFYKEKNTLPNTSSELLQLIIDLKIENDIKHFEKNGKKLKLFQNEIFSTAEKIASLMQLLGKNFITDNELHTLIKNNELIDILKHSFVIIANNNYVDRRQFEHNNFQEYLAAKFLSKQKIEVIKEFVSFKPNYEKIKPNWLNTLTHLFSIIPQDSEKFELLLKWIISIEPKALVRLEIDKIGIEIREDIFIEIVRDSIEKCVSLYSEDFNFDELLKFSGTSDKVLKFLLENLEIVQHENNLIDTIELLSEVNNLNDVEDRLYEVFKKILETHENNYNIIYHTLLAISKLELFEENFINYLFDKFGNSKSSHKRYGLLEIFLKAPNTEELTLKFLNIAPFTKHEIGVHVNEPGKSFEEEPQMYGVNEKLSKCITKITSYDGLVKLIKYYSNNILLFNFEKNDKTQDKIIDNIIEIDNRQGDIFDLMLIWFMNLSKAYQEEEMKIVKRYFDETNNTFRAFKVLANGIDDSNDIKWAACSLANKECIEYLIQEYLSCKLGDDDIYLFRNGLGWKNKELFEDFYIEINSISNNKFIYPQQRNYEEERIERIKEDIKLLFDKVAFENKVDEIFIKHGKELTKEYLWELRKSKLNDEELEDNIVINTLRELADNNLIVTKELVEDQILKENRWLWFKLYHLDKYSKAHIEFLEKEHLEWIKNWCSKEIESADFTTAITYNGDRTYTYRYKEMYLFNFFITLKLDYPVEKKLDMLEYGWIGDSIQNENNPSVNYLISKLNENALKRRILTNLKKGLKVKHILTNHISLVEKYSIESAQPFIISEIKNVVLDEWDKARAIKVYINIGGKPSKLEELLEFVTFKENWNWKLFEALSSINSSKSITKLKEAIIDDNNWIEVTNALIRFKQKEGLELILKRLTEKRSLPYDYEMPTSEIVKISPKDIFKTLVSILKFAYLSEYKFGKYRRIDEQVFRCLDELIGTNEETFLSIRKIISEEIISNLVDTEKKGYINFWMKRMEKTFYTKKSETVGLNECIKLINGLK